MVEDSLNNEDSYWREEWLPMLTVNTGYQWNRMGDPALNQPARLLNSLYRSWI